MPFGKQSKTKEPENVEKAYEYAVFLLSLKLRTIGEVLKKMSDRGFTQPVIEKTINQLKQQRYLDDQRYAEIYLENLKTYRNFGFYGIKKKLLDKKLPSALVEKLLAENLLIKDEQKIAERLLKKEGFEVKEKSVDEEVHYRTFDEEASKEKTKLSNRLRARGFRGEVIARLLF
jgi:regulatory protein